LGERVLGERHDDAIADAIEHGAEQRTDLFEGIGGDELGHGRLPFTQQATDELL
jgi:hypothetical protein